VLSQQDWTALAAIGTIAATAISFYRWIWVPHTKEAEEKKRTIYKPNYDSIQILMRWIGEFNVKAVHDKRLAYESSNSSALPSQIRVMLADLYKKIDEFRDWHLAAESRIALEIYKASSDRSELAAKYKSECGSDLAADLVNSIAPRVVEGVQITKSWILDNTGFYSRIQKMQKLEDFDNMVSGFTSRFSDYGIKIFLDRLRECQKEALRLGDNVSSELRKLCGAMV